MVARERPIPQATESMVTDKLTRNQKLVYRKLCSHQGALSAYDLLDALREHGLRAPPQVYRALEKLVQEGLVHRLESINAFVACSDPCCDASAARAFAICSGCNSVTELAVGNLETELKSLSGTAGFELHSPVVELKGTCKQCVVATVEKEIV